MRGLSARRPVDVWHCQNASNATTVASLTPKRRVVRRMPEFRGASVKPHAIEPSLSKMQYLRLRRRAGLLMRYSSGLWRKLRRPDRSYSLRENFVELVGKNKKILEIGPFFRPIFTGDDVCYFDVLDTNELRERAASAGYPVSSIPNIDFVSAVGDLSIVNAEFDAVVSSHCIEHQPDFIEHLKQVERIISGDGRYFLIIPDKRYCFDHFIAQSTIAGIIDAHVERRTKHRLASVIEHRALTTHNDPVRHWRGDHADLHYHSSIAARTKMAIEEYNSANGKYIDVHAWQFTPDSFRQLMTTLVEAGLSPLGVERVYPTPSGRNEFIAVLAKAASRKEAQPGRR